HGAGQLRGHDAPRPVQLLPVEPACQPAGALLLDELVRAAVPDLAGAGAVVPLRDLAFEGGVVEGVVLDVNGEMLLTRLERDALGHRPALERSVPLEAEVVVETPRVVTLDDEDRLLRLPLPGEGLGRLLPVALALVLAELPRHLRRFALRGRSPDRQSTR